MLGWTIELYNYVENLSEFPDLRCEDKKENNYTQNKKLHDLTICLSPWSYSNFTISRKFYKM